MKGRHRTLTSGERTSRAGEPAVLVRYDYIRFTLRLEPKLYDRAVECAALCEVSLNAFVDGSVTDMCNRVQRKRSREETEGNDHDE